MPNTLPLGPFLGVNNRLPDYSLHVSKVGDYLSAADKVDVDNAGKLHRAAVPTLIQAMTGAHSLFMLDATNGVLVRASTLYAVTLPAYSETLLKVLTSDAAMSYVSSGGDLFYSNGTDAGRVTSGVAYPLGLPTPAAPTLSVLGGTMHAGAYQVALSFSNTTTGEEGGISASNTVTLATEGGVRVTLPTVPAGATHVNVYLTPVNGSTALLVATLPSGTSVADFTAVVSSYGRQENGRDEDPLPAGTLFMSNGRLCSFSDNMVYIGLPYRYGYYDPLGGFVRFASAVKVAIENQTGTYLVADKTYWIPGDLGNVQEMMRDVLPFSAVPGTAFTHPTQAVVGWYSEKGVVLADTNGQAKALTLDVLDVTPPASGVSTVLSSRGYRRVVSCGWCVNLDTSAATQYSHWAFTSTSGSYGTQADGLYALEGGTTLIGSACFGKIDFGSETLKALPAVYAGMASESPLELTVRYTDEGNEAQEYTYPTRACSSELQIQRFDTGKGIRSNWFDLSISNADGDDFTLASISFAPTASVRRI